MPLAIVWQWSGYMARIRAVVTNLSASALWPSAWWLASGSPYTTPLVASRLWSERSWRLSPLASSRLQSAWSQWNRAPSTVPKTVLGPQQGWYLQGGNLHIVCLLVLRLWSWCPAPLAPSRQHNAQSLWNRALSRMEQKLNTMQQKLLLIESEEFVCAKKSRLQTLSLQTIIQLYWSGHAS